MKVKEYAEKHGLSRKKVYEMCRSGELDAEQVPQKRGGKPVWEIKVEEPKEEDVRIQQVEPDPEPQPSGGEEPPEKGLPFLEKTLGPVSMKVILVLGGLLLMLAVLRPPSRSPEVYSTR